MVEWTKEQQDIITSLYGQLKDNYEREANKKLFGGPQLPYEQARDILENLVKQQKQEGGLESKITAHPSSVFERIGSLFSKPAVAASATALLLLYLGLPPVY